MQNSFESIVSVLETYRGRDKVLVGGVLSQRSGESSQLGKSLLLLSAQLSHCRVVLRLFDDLSMAAYSADYGLGTTEEDSILRWMSVLNNVADQLYYPCEHIAWAADAALIKGKSDRWWTLSTVLWGTSLLLGILRSIRIILKTKRKVETSGREGHAYHREGAVSSTPELRRQIRREALTVFSSVADLCNAIHWMPPGFLWAGRFPHWLVGLLGTVSSVIGMLQMNSSEERVST
ncbi:peroxisomal membrane protein 11C isoform X2 [Chanos chanos]|uniref:Peroxisomal membrane protein 11C isoform X2 n=1 Tax=Chanos chanos TaxID=29144 RepID=A0A6J2W8E3_CHACN|nr:peroxisomal membrane protein 11C isoform X2 [Chanos chanos]